jgi:hypothetical protein
MNVQPFDKLRVQQQQLMTAIEAGFWYTRPGEDGFITYRLYWKHSTLPDKCIGEFSRKREVEAAMIRRHGESTK